MTRIKAILRRLGGFTLLPLSLVPFIFAVPVLAQQHDTYRRLHQSGPVAAPAVSLDAGERARYAQLPPAGAQVPVLVYHGINRDRDGYSVSPEAFARQMLLLRQAGFESVSVAQYARFRDGDLDGLPSRPVLITFDDGRLDSYRHADRILAREHLRAAMYVIGRPIERKDLSHLTWKELHRMADSGRWDVQPHAFDGHQKLAVDDRGNHAPFYAARRFLRSTGRETFADYEQRVSEDVFRTREMMHDQGLAAPTFAVPYGDYGQRTDNDPRIARFMAALLARQFGTYFVQVEGNDPGYTHPGTGPAERYEVHTDTSLDDLYGWLRRHHPATLAAAAKARAEREAEARAARRARTARVRAARARAARARAARRSAPTSKSNQKGH